MKRKYYFLGVFVFFFYILFWVLFFKLEINNQLLTLYYKYRYPLIPTTEFLNKRNNIKQSNFSYIGSYVYRDRFFQPNGIETSVIQPDSSTDKVYTGIVTNIENGENNTKSSNSGLAITLKNGSDRGEISIASSTSIMKHDWSIVKGVVVGHQGFIRRANLEEISIGDHVIYQEETKLLSILPKIE